MRDTLVEVPAMAGDGAHPAGAGPAVLSRALGESGCDLPVTRLPLPRFSGDIRAASLEVNRRLADLVGRVVAGGRRPVVLAGSCDVAPGVLAGIGEQGLGVVWIDAHADFNTPASSTSGFWPGMTLAVVAGDCGEEVWSALGCRPVAPGRIALFGTRSLSPAEESRRLDASAITVVPWHEGHPEQDVAVALDRLAREVDRVYLHLDLDALDPAVGTGVVDPPVPGGLSLAQLAELLDETRERFDVAGITIATYTPGKDDGGTLHAAVSAIRRLSDCGCS